MTTPDDKPTDLTDEGLSAIARHPWWLAAAVALVALGLFLPVMGSDAFVGDEDSVLRVSLVSHVRNVPKIFGRDFMIHTDGIYRPLAYAMLAAVRTVVPARLTVFWRLWMLAFHVLNALLVYRLVREFTTRPVPALAALGVFALHPAASTVIGQINLFPHVLAVTLYLGSFLAYVRFARARKHGLYLLSLALFAAGLFTSRAVLTLPVLILFWELLHEHTHPLRTLFRLAPFALCIIPPAMLWVNLRPHPVFYAYPQKAHQDAAWYWAYGFAAGGVDTALALLTGRTTPVAVSAFTGTIANAWNARTLFYGSVLVGGLLATLWGLRKRGWLFIGVFLLMVGVAGRFHSYANLSADYVSWTLRYLPLAGFAFLIAAVADRLLRVASANWRRVVTAVAAVGVAACAAFLVAANLRLGTPVDYWRHAVRENPKSQIASVHLGKALLEAGQTDEAIEHLFSPVLTSIRLSSLTMANHYTREGQPLAALLHLHLAMQEGSYQLGVRRSWLLQARLLQSEGALDLAEQILGQVLMIDPNDTSALRQLGSVLTHKGYLRAARVCFEDALEIDPNDAWTRTALAALRRRMDAPARFDTEYDVEPPDPNWLRYMMDDRQDAVIHADVFKLADALPEDPIVQLSAAVFRGRSLRGIEARTPARQAEKQRQYADAIRRLDRALAHLPNYTYAQARKCWLASTAGNKQLALDTLKHAQHLKLGDALTWHRLGLTLLGEGHVTLAIEAFRTATIASANFGESHNNIGLLLVRRQSQPETPDERMKRYREAVGHFEKALRLPRSKRGGAHNGLGFALMNLGRVDEAIPHFRRAIAIDADRATAYYFLAQAHESQNQYHDCVRVLSMGMKVLPESMLLRTYLAMMLSSAPEPGVLDGKRAVALAKSVCRSVDRPTARMLDLLAAAYAQNRQFDEAVKTAGKAIAEARREGENTFAQVVRERRELYRGGIPFRLPRTAGPIR